MKGYEKKKLIKLGGSKWDGIEVQRGREKDLGVKGMMAWGSIANSAPYKLEPKVVVVGRSKLLNNCFFFCISS